MIPKSITIVFENCESITYSYEDVVSIDVGNHSKYAEKWEYNGTIYTRYEIKKLKLILKNNKPIKTFLFSDEHADNPVSRFMNDITTLYIENIDNTETCYYLKWSNTSNEYYADNQKFIINDSFIQIETC